MAAMLFAHAIAPAAALVCGHCCFVYGAVYDVADGG